MAIGQPVASRTRTGPGSTEVNQVGSLAALIGWSTREVGGLGTALPASTDHDTPRSGEPRACCGIGAKGKMRLGVRQDVIHSQATQCDRRLIHHISRPGRYHQPSVDRGAMRRIRQHGRSHVGEGRVEGAPQLGQALGGGRWGCTYRRGETADAYE